VYDIGLELRKPRSVKTKDEEKQQSSDRSAINVAVAQVLRGLAALSTPFGECAIGEPARRKEADIPARGLHYCGSLGD